MNSAPGGRRSHRVDSGVDPLPAIHPYRGARGFVAGVFHQQRMPGLYAWCRAGVGKGEFAVLGE